MYLVEAMLVDDEIIERRVDDEGSKEGEIVEGLMTSFKSTSMTKCVYRIN